MVRFDIDPDMFISAVFQTRDELSDLSEIASNQSLRIIILDALPDDMNSTIKVQSIRTLGFIILLA